MLRRRRVQKALIHRAALRPFDFAQGRQLKIIADIYYRQ
jgi:hypothetical protein